MELSLEKKVAVVTGGSRGIGLAIAKRYAKAGASVLITSRKPEALEAACDEIEGDTSFFAANAGEPDQARACIEMAMSRYGHIDLLVNNAGTNPYFGPLAGLDLPRASKTVQLNQMAVLVWSQLFIEANPSLSAGSILNIASIGGYEVEPGIGWYNVTKAAVIHLTRQLAAELGPAVRVNAIAPGLVRTDLARALWESNEPAIASRLPLRRIGEPDDIARLALFLASDAASWITGQTLVVDGGAMVAPGGGVSP